MDYIVYIIGAFIALNIITFLTFGLDKLKAKKGKWRIPESTLLIMAIIGGSIGAYSGMKVWRHKTMHKKFKYGIPAIILMQVGISLYALKYIQ